MRKLSIINTVSLGLMMINNFALIIGAMKCGTTSLFSYLAQHPEISACQPKEPDFFSYDDHDSTT